MLIDKFLSHFSQHINMEKGAPLERSYLVFATEKKTPVSRRYENKELMHGKC